MPGWLVRNDRLRPSELLAEFLRLSAPPATPEETFSHACELLRHLWEAKGVALWALDSAGRRLWSRAASDPEWEFGGELSLDAFPELERALAQPVPEWVEQVATRWQLLPPPLLEAASVLIVPVGASSRPPESGSPESGLQGCLVGLFGKGSAAPLPEEQGVGQSLARCLGFLLEAEILRDQRDLLVRQRDSRRRLEGDLVRLGGLAAGLQRLAAAAREMSATEAAGVYERHPAGFRQLAAAGAAHLLPLELPLGESPVLPWQRALAEGRALVVEPDQLASVLQPWLPYLAGSGLPLAVLPLQTREAPLGVLLLCGTGATAVASSDDGDWAGLQLLATGALESRRGLTLQEQHLERHQALLEHADEGIFYLDAAGNLLQGNPFLSQLTGYAAEKLEQPSLAEFLHPDDWQSLSAWLQGEALPVFQGRWRWRNPAGSWSEIDVALYPVSSRAAETRILGLAQDTTRERQAGQCLAASEARLQGLLDSVHDGVWLIGGDGRVEFANHRLGQLLGVPAQQIGPGQPHLEVVEQLKDRFHAPEKVLERWRQLHAHPEQVYWDELELPRPRRRVLERFARPLFDTEHRLVGRLEVYRDITPQRLLEDKVLQREKLATLGQLVSGIAHELNNPLTAVAGYAQLLAAASLPPDLRDKIQHLTREAQRAGRVVQNLLLFAREAKAEKQAMEPAEILERTLSLREYELTVGNIQVGRDFDPPGHPVWADPHQLQQVFLNLLLNAEQAIRSQRHRGRILLRTRWQAEENQVRVEISDDGPGILAAALPHIFDPFFTTKSAQEGTGLGLTISQTIVKEHGGEISVESPPGQGATFIVQLPAYQAEALPVAPLPLPRPARAGDRKLRRILVVDDEPAVAHLIADALGQQGYTVRVHTDSRRALAEACEQSFHMAICDIRMPDLSGPAFYRALRDRRSDLARRLLFTTGDTLARETAAFLEEVRLPYLAKPFRVEELRSVVRELLQEWERSTSGDDGSSRGNARRPAHPA